MTKRSRARARRIIARVGAVAPALAVLLVDLAHRSAMYPAMLRSDFIAMLITWALSTTLWTGAMVTSARRRSAMRWIALVVIALLGAVTALQAAAFEYFGVTIDFQLLRSTWQLEGMETIARPFLGTIARWMSVGALVAVAWGVLIARLARAKRANARRAAIVTLGALVISVTATTYLPHTSTSAAPDVLAVGAMARFAVEHPKRNATVPFVAIPDVEFPRTVAPVAPAVPSVRRNVLFVLTESVRATAFCSAYGNNCEHNPFSNAALPSRLPLERMRAVDSATLLSFGVIFSGVAVDASKNDWLTAPLLFDYAHAAGIATAYLSAQHPAFLGSHAWTDGEPIDRLAWATDFDPNADKMLGADDADVVDRAISDLPGLGEPFFAVVHFSGTHFPYRIDSDAPFRPIGALDRRDPTPLRNRYFDAIYRQDKLTAKLVMAVRAMPLSARTVIVFVSDHGESFYEHESALHGASVWDPELRVPAWIDAPTGSLSATELTSLRALRDVPVTEEDLAPTILDLLGLYGVIAWKEVTARMVGDSLLRSPARDRMTSIATCNDLWPCFVPSSGKLIGDRKWVKRPPEAFRCFDTRSDPEEQHDLGAAACAPASSQF